MPEEAALYENETYYVIPLNVEDDPITFQGATYYAAYGIINSETGMLEYQSISLPDACHNAEAMNVAMLNQPWLWMRDKITRDDASELVGALSETTEDPTKLN
jgi:hypothetical protein